jgi:predicted RNase H-like HicB family nuclease
MQYQVLVQNPADHTFMASVFGLPEMAATGVTEKEAIGKLKGILDAQFKNGKIVTIDINLPEETSLEKGDPWIDNIGIFQDDPTFDEFLTEVSTYRNEIDNNIKEISSNCQH